MDEAPIDARQVYRECRREARMRIVSMVDGKRVDLIADQVYIMFAAEADNSLEGVFWVALPYYFKPRCLLSSIIT